MILRNDLKRIVLALLLIIIIYIFVGIKIIVACSTFTRASQVALVKNLTAKAEEVRDAVSIPQEDPLEKGMATHSGILAWRIPWTKELGGLQPIGSQRVGQFWSNLASKHTLPLYVMASKFHSVQFSHSVISDYLLPHGLQHARLPCLSPTPRDCSNPNPREMK